MPGPTPITQRALGPDLARGCLLLFIALANSHYFLSTEPVLGGFPQEGRSPLDQAVTWVIATFVDGRAFPMFGLLFGYGVARIVARQDEPLRDVRRLLRRRGVVLLAIGLVDCFLLFAGDIVVMYGVLVIVGAWTVGWKDRTLLIVAALFLLLTALPNDVSMSTSTDGPDAAMLPDDLGEQLTGRVLFAAVIGLGGPIGFAAPFLVGMWAGRRRILERPERHLRLLTVTAVVGLVAAVAGAQPAALATAGYTDPLSDGATELLGPLHDLTGALGGAGYAALIALVSIRLAPRAGRVTRALAATGQRSLTCYLAQSPVWFVVFTPYLLDLSATLSITATAALATGTWLGTVVLADRLRAAGRRGPFEVLVRRWTYRGAATGAG